MTENERIKKYAKRIEEGKSLAYVFGALGDSGKIEDITGIVEEVIPQENECPKIKYLGISYLQSGVPLGFPEAITLESISTLKVMFFRLPVKLLEKPFALLFFWLLARKTFYSFIYDYLDLLHGATVRKVNMYGEKRNFYAQEILRAFKKAIKGEKEIIRKILDKFIDMVVFLFEWDYPYRYPLQDVLSQAKKGGDPIKELNRLLDIAIERYDDGYEIKDKVIFVKRAVEVLKFLPAFKRIVKGFLNELDSTKMEISEGDWYFCLNRIIYHFKGLGHEERVAIRDRLDKEKGHIKVNFKPLEEKEFKDWSKEVKNL